MFSRIYSSLEIKKAIECYDRVRSFRKASKLSGVSKSTIHRWYYSFHKFLLRPKYQARKRKRSPKHLKFPTLVHDLTALFSGHDSIKMFTLKDIQQRLELHKQPSISWIHECLKKARISRRRFSELSKVCARSQSEITAMKKEFKDRISYLKDEEIVCLDETGFCNIGNATYGYFPKGKTPNIVHVRRREKTSVIMAILPAKGVVAYKLQSKPFNKETFISFLKDSLLPSLSANAKAILMDNVAFHRSFDVKKLITDHGLIPLYIPPYSPRCNPIEEVFSILKHSFRTSYQPSEPFSQCVQASVEKLKLYKGFSHHYNHTRSYLEMIT